ncbi:hypothetical protein H0I76_15640 [Limibaculum sp. M0105]|uniref:Uncharacterized protein n=1 Tax=Thermohalobaculum xanthum TaxID=2753746 RepID=A0A8J7M8N0_9RHOB|nr:hypothetical protein [Thermohalobaculum xanthum]MBK0400631.1 hypothetical protein [Thermohalobaculum xanthum]
MTDAVRFCDRHKVPHPDWLKAAVRSLADPPQKRKRGQPPADEADLIRWDVVVMLRLGRGEDRKVYKWDEVFEAASKYLEGTPHWGTADTISASYKRVIKRDRLTPGRYYTKDL